MKTLLITIIVLMLLAAPVRLAAYWFKAERGTWLRSIGLLLGGALLVNLALHALPEALTSKAFARFLISVVLLTLASQLLLYVKAWQALAIALFLATFYSMGEGNLGSAEISAGTHGSAAAGAESESSAKN